MKTTTVTNPATIFLAQRGGMLNFVWLPSQSPEPDDLPDDLDDARGMEVDPDTLVTLIRSGKLRVYVTAPSNGARL